MSIQHYIAGVFVFGGIFITFTSPQPYDLIGLYMQGFGGGLAMDAWRKLYNNEKRN